MTVVSPWAQGPFELLVHAEGHLREGGDFDRRIALISFDNAIEVAITTYLTLNPIQRGGRTYPSAQVETWLNNYHTKLDFLGTELTARDLQWAVERGHVVWAHDCRNEQYHSGRKGTPERQVLMIIRDAAFWVVSLLFDLDEVESALEGALRDVSPASGPPRERQLDVAIDAEFGIIDVGEQRYYASELLFSVDPIAYRELGERLRGPADRPNADAEGDAPQ